MQTWECVGDKISIAEARARRTDPVWRRRHFRADVLGITFVVLLLLLPPLSGLLWPPVARAVAAVIMLGVPAVLWWRGPEVGLERRAALLVAIPVLNLFVLIPAVWRLAHLGIQQWQGPLEPPWGDRVWIVAGAAGIACWLAALTSLVLTLI